MDWRCNVLPSPSWLGSDKEDGFRGVSLGRRHNVFLILPPELRLMVYSLLLSPTGETKHLLVTFARPGCCFSPPDSLHPAILRTCQLIYGEAIKMLYSNMFVVDLCEATLPRHDPNLGQWCRRIGHRNASTIKSLRLLGYYEISLPYGEKRNTLLAIYSWTIGLTMNLILQYLNSVQRLEIKIYSRSSKMYMKSPRHYHARCRDIHSRLGPELWVDMWDPPFERFITRSESVKEIVVPHDYRPMQEEDRKVLQQYLQGLLEEKKRCRELEEAKEKGG